MLELRCGSCQRTFMVQEANAGGPVVCPYCRVVNTVPAVALPVAAAAAPQQPAYAAPAAPTPTPYAAPPRAPVPAGPRRPRGVSIAGLICGIVGLVLAFSPCCLGCLSFPTALAGLVCSIIGLVMANNANRPKGMAITGLILSIIALIWWPIFIFLILGMSMSQMQSMPGQ